MILLKDISERIESDYKEQAAEVISILENAIAKADYLNESRIIRFVLFLADKNVESLKRNIAAAIADPRDVMYWAEYINHDKFDKTQRVRDFSKPFNEAGVV